MQPTPSIVLLLPYQKYFKRRCLNEAVFLSLYSAVYLLLTQPQYYRIGCFLMLVKPTARTEKSTQILCVLNADVGHPKSTAEKSS